MVTDRRPILLNGLLLTLCHGRAVLWTYVFNLALSALFLLHMHGQLQALLNTSLASQSLISGFDLSTGVSAFTKILEGAPGGAASNFSNIPVYLLLYFLLVPGTLFCYQTSAPARLSTLLHSGISHFWRFVRITLLSFVIFALILGPLLALQNQWSTHVENTVVGRSAVLYDLAGILLIGLVAAILRIFFDLVEVYTVQLGLQRRFNGEPDRRVRRTLLPAWRTLRDNFGPIYGTCVMLTLLGLSAVVITARIAMHSLAQPRVWPMFLIAQLGLLFMLFTRFWQRGAETILALSNPMRDPALLRQMDPFPSDLPTMPPPPPSTPTPYPTEPQPDPLPDPEPSSPSLPRPDRGVFGPTQ